MRILCVVCVLLGLGGGALKASETPSFKDVTIIVSSCDRYAPLWPAFFHCLFKQWGTLKTVYKDVPILLIGNKKSYPDARVTNVLTGEDKSWSDNMLLALQSVKTTYVLYLQDDYLFYKPVNMGRLSAILDGMRQNAIPYCQLNSGGGFIASPVFKGIPGTIEKGAWLSWHMSLQSALWRTDVLRYLIKREENPWAFEWEGQLRRRVIRAPFVCVVKDEPLCFLNAVALGRVRRSNLMFLEQDGLDSDALVALSRVFPLLDDYQAGAEQATYPFLLSKACVLEQRFEVKRKKRGLARFWQHLKAMKF
jgi:hypothetical protein